MFADQGLEFCGVDQRGFGSSEGTRGRIESVDSVLADLQSFTLKYKEQFGADTPIFLLGESMGGLYATHLANQFPNDYAGICLIAPAFGLHDPTAMEKMLYQLQQTHTTIPDKLEQFYPTNVELYKKQWYEDEQNLSWHVSLHTL